MSRAEPALCKTVDVEPRMTIRTIGSDGSTALAPLVTFDRVLCRTGCRSRWTHRRSKLCPLLSACCARVVANCNVHAMNVHDSNNNRRENYRGTANQNITDLRYRHATYQFTNRVHLIIQFVPAGGGALNFEGKDNLPDHMRAANPARNARETAFWLTIEPGVRV